jgi:hypothetical protein
VLGHHCGVFYGVGAAIGHVYSHPSGSRHGSPLS